MTKNIKDIMAITMRMILDIDIDACDAFASEINKESNNLHDDDDDDDSNARKKPQ